MSGLLKSSIGRKFAMALSAFFLMLFLLQHFIINITSIFPDNGATFNKMSHFMGTNPAIQYLMQPILIFGVVYHFVMGFVLEYKNGKARKISYAQNKGNANSTWMSRNMLISGAVILAFLLLHFIDFWIPEINTKFIQGDWSGMHDKEFRYFIELQHKFANPLRVGAYILAFVFLALHLLHGFSSAFQSIGVNNKYTRGLKTFGKLFAIIIPLGFIIIAMFHYFNH
ncbi:succinate dehydrogenase cytochrome b subunit [Tenacibaculum sp. UWU-22]|uniref:succinate dehydrogenase cytochrome b subunit n=1 Tax=Tenacibaculum sp. UWU-22 TaxID=3234187 RepID=UPI0034DB14EF